MVGPVGAVTATSLVMIPDQPAVMLGGEIILVGLVMVVTPIVVQARTWRARENVTPTEPITRAIMSVGFGLAFVIGGALLFDSARAGLYWIAAGDIFGIIAVALSAWVLLVEILR